VRDHESAAEVKSRPTVRNLGAVEPWSGDSRSFRDEAHRRSDLAGGVGAREEDELEDAVKERKMNAPNGYL
jgi:hypothetical protein